MANNTSIRLDARNPNLDKDRSKKWSIPPVLSTDPAAIPDQSFTMTQGIVYEIKNEHNALLQNVSENEDDVVEFSYHGDKDGVWQLLNTHTLLKIYGGVFLLNRSHKQNIPIAVIMVDCKTCLN